MQVLEGFLAGDRSAAQPASTHVEGSNTAAAASNSVQQNKRKDELFGGAADRSEAKKSSPEVTNK